MIIRYFAPGPWWDRGIHLLRLLPQADIRAKTECWNLDVRVEIRQDSLYIAVTDGENSENAIIPAEKRTFLRTLFQVLSKVQQAPLSPWGVLTGVRPGKVAARLVQELGFQGAEAELCRDWLLSEEKAKLLLDCVRHGYPLLAQRGLSLYVSVPFCPSRCYYCSFSSLSLSKWRNVLATYVDRASRELSELLAACRRYGYPVNSIYVGGGTPTSLEPRLLEEMLAPARRPGCEFTVEAGRPDTLSREHMRVLESLGVTRVSINSQYPNEETLRAIGRQHSVEQFYGALALAEDSGIGLVNSDLIIGLPGQTPGGFADVISRLEERGVDNITIHALALKRGAQTRRQYMEPGQAREIAEAAYCRLEELGYAPYYLYRQKNIASNLENVGFAKPGTYCYYNIASIAETEPVLGVGAGAVSKLVRRSLIETLNNPRDPNQYLQRSSTLVRRKLDWLRSIS